MRGGTWGAEGASAPLPENFSPPVGEKLTVCRGIVQMITHLYIVQTMNARYRLNQER